ncbi:transglutaminase-like domain-containing protein [Myxococcota bacterium]|nr:transglutaminase-like domain-containing protein [Myxococcota bacterium]
MSPPVGSARATTAPPPRPLSSYTLATVASLSLAVTGTIALPALLAQALALTAGLRLRTRSRGWQRHGVVLNALLLAIIAFSLGFWLRGGSALVALAHFALLAQGLQLLDARPRRSDFVLVALGLFQMILAANLTDSLLFPVFLAVFVAAMVWTLVVHTLWVESLAAGEPWLPERAFSPRLLRTTMVATLFSLALAILIFLVLPRVRSGALSHPGLRATPQAGFSDRVTLGDLGRIRQDPTVVLRVETLAGTPPPREASYWRGLAFDHFDGRHWSVTPRTRRYVSPGADLGVDLGPHLAPEDLVQRVLREPMAAGVLFAAGVPTHVTGSFGRIERDDNGGLYAPDSEQDRVQYAIRVASAESDETALHDDHARPPAGTGTRYLHLPPISDRIRTLAGEIVAGAASDAARVAAIERHLLRSGRYDDRPPPETGGALGSPIEAFLLEETAGHCEYFASGMIVLVRALGLPARLVNGFAGGRENVLGGFVELARSDAHAWVEVHYERAGWVRYDPTPVDARLRADAFGLLAQMQGLGRALEHWWFQHIVEFDRSRQMNALRSGWMQWRRWRTQPRGALAAGEAPTPGRKGFDGGVLATLTAALAVAGAGLWIWSRRRRPYGYGVRLPSRYGEALRLLERHRGLVRPAALPAREFAREVSRTVPPAASAAFWALTESYLAERFGSRPAPSRRAELRTLRDTLRRR